MTLKNCFLSYFYQRLVKFSHQIFTLSEYIIIDEYNF